MKIDYSKPVPLDLKKLQILVNPFKSCIWIKCETPITRKEISQAIRIRAFIDPETNKKAHDQGIDDGFFWFWDNASREEHVARIAYLVENYSNKYPINVDFGIPDMGVYFELNDGHHRIAAAMYKKEPYIMASVSGLESEIEKYIYKK